MIEFQRCMFILVNKIPYYWIIDPIQKTLEVLMLNGEFYQVTKAFQGKDKVLAEPFEVLEINLTELWE